MTLAASETVPQTQIDLKGVVHPGAATPVWQVWQLPYLGVQIFQKQVTQWAKSGDIGAKNRRKWPKSLSNGQKAKWGNAATNGNGYDYLPDLTFIYKIYTSVHR